MFCCCVCVCTCCGGSFVWYTLRSFTSGGCSVCGMVVLNMENNFRSDAVFFSPKYCIGLVGAGFWTASVSSATMCVTESAG